MKRLCEMPERFHKKSLSKHTLSNIITRGNYSNYSSGGYLYHYTSPEGLRGILQSRNFFFTDCQYLNDSKERININNDLDAFWKCNRRKYAKEFVHLLKDIRINVYEDSEYSYIESDLTVSGEEIGNARYFVFSTSFNRDSLSMWKYYAKDGRYNGYNVGIFSIALIDEWIDRVTGISVEEGAVLYKAEDKQALILETVEKLYEQWCTYKVSEAFNKKIALDFQSWVSIASLFFKDECFSSEEEYRYVAIAPVDKLSTLTYEDDQGRVYNLYDFRIVNGVFTPYIKLPFNCWNIEECWVIDSIGISPSANFEQKKNGLEQFIKSLGYKLAHQNIFSSKIPLRY